MLEPPCQPTPMQPIVIRSLGATLPALPRAEELTMYGNATTPTAVPAAALRNCRRLTFWFVAHARRLPNQTSEAWMFSQHPRPHC